MYAFWCTQCVLNDLIKHFAVIEYLGEGYLI